MLSIFAIGIRVLLLLCGAVVLGLSVTLAKQQLAGSVPAETSFSSFTGAFGIIVSFLGLAALFFESLPTVVTLGADLLSTVLYLAGGVALAVALKGVSCTSNSDEAQYDRYYNKLLDSGCVSVKNESPVCGVSGQTSDVQGELKARCVRVQADFAFQFIALIFTLGALALFLVRRRGAGKSTFV